MTDVPLAMLPPAPILHFPPFALDRQRGQLLHNGTPLHLRPKTLALLTYFAEHPGSLLTKSELFGAVWADSAVTDSVLSVCINDLRRALGDDPAQPRFLETVHRRGFRFVAAVSDRPDQPTAAIDGATLFGREREIAALDHLWQQALTGKPQLLFLNGDAGAGKTALLDAFLSRLPPAALLPLRGRCLDLNGVAEPFLPLLQALSELCRGPHASLALSALRRTAPSWLLQLNLPLEAEEQEALRRRYGQFGRAAMLRELVSLLGDLSEALPVVVALEDLHWSDPSTVDAIVSLRQLRSASRLLLIGTLRPAESILNGHPRTLLHEGVGRHSDWSVLPLDLLPQSAVHQYLASRFGGPDVADALAPELHSRTDGNPLFMIAVVDDWVERGVLREDGGRWRCPPGSNYESVPPSLSRLLRDQLADFDEPERQALAAASVAGMTFPAQLVAAGLAIESEQAEAICERLRHDRRFLVDGGSATWADGSCGQVYRFRHAIYQNVVQTLIPAARRQQLHRRIGDRLELGLGDQAAEIPLRLAQHFSEGGDPQRAFRYFELAGEKAFERNAYREAIATLQAAHQALLLTPPGLERDSSELRVLARLVPLMLTSRGFSDPEAQFLLARLRELAVGGRQTASVVLALSSLCLFWQSRGDMALATTIAEQLVVIAEASGEPLWRSAAHQVLGGNSFRGGLFASACVRFEESLAIAATIPDAADNPWLTLSVVSAHCQLGVIHSLTGDPERGRSEAEQGLAAGLRSQFPPAVSMALVLAAWTYLLRDDAERVETLVNDPAMSRGDLPTPLWGAIATVLRGWAWVRQGRIEAGLAAVEQGFEAYLNSQGDSSSFDYQVPRCDAYLRAGRFAAGLEIVPQALRTLELYGQAYFAPELHRIHGELLLGHGIDHAAEARDCFELGLNLARASGAVLFEQRLLHSLERLSPRVGA